MTSTGRTLFPAICGGLTATLGVAGFVGWVANLPMLTQLGADSIPMAPNTAACFFMMGVCLPMLTSPRSKLIRRTTNAMAGVVVGLTSLRLFEDLSRFDLGVDHWLPNVPAGTLGLAPVGKMTLITTLAMFASGTAVMVLSSHRSRIRSIGGMIGLAVALAGTTFALGFLVGEYAGGAATTIPMALGAALGFMAVGGGLAVAAGPYAYPLRPFVDASVRARLLRGFLPFVVGAAFVSACLASWFARADHPYRALTTSTTAVGAALAAAVLCLGVAHRVGSDLKRAEAELRKAKDELEDRVVERTSQLSMTAGDLEKAAAEANKASRELRRAQALLMQAEKLAGLGQIVAGVAHEINNPLAFVVNNVAILEGYTGDVGTVLAIYRKGDSDLAAHRPDLAAEIAETAEQVHLDYALENAPEVFARSKDGLKRIVQIVKDLREFARLDRSERETADLNAGIESTINIVRCRANNSGVAIETELGELPRVECHPAKINQVVMNLISNAIDACATGGRIVVRTRSVGGGVEIDVEDNGSGVDASIRDKLFDPFFTTKPVGQGTGLGLSISYGIVQEHGGRIDVKSQVGKGTRFRVFLPTNAQPSPPETIR